jgi:hypothetical protein
VLVRLLSAVHHPTGPVDHRSVVHVLGRVQETAVAEDGRDGGEKNPTEHVLQLGAGHDARHVKVKTVLEHTGRRRHPRRLLLENVDTTVHLTVADIAGGIQERIHVDERGKGRRKTLDERENVRQSVQTIRTALTEVKVDHNGADLTVTLSQGGDSGADVDAITPSRRKGSLRRGREIVGTTGERNVSRVPTLVIRNRTGVRRQNTMQTGQCITGRHSHGMLYGMSMIYIHGSIQANPRDQIVLVVLTPGDTMIPHETWRSQSFMVSHGDAGHFTEGGPHGGLRK